MPRVARDWLGQGSGALPCEGPQFLSEEEHAELRIMTLSTQAEWFDT